MSEIWLQNVFFPGIIPLGPVVPYQQCIVLFGVDHMCLTRHSIGTLSHHLSCRLLLLVEGVPSTIWDTDVERIDRTSGGWERREGTQSLSTWMTMTAVGHGQVRMEGQ